MKEYQINVIAGTKVLADMAQSIRDKTINDQRMKAVPPGALPAGPVDKEMYMVLESPGRWTFGGTNFDNVEGQIMTLWWEEEIWSINSIVPKTEVIDGFESDNEAVAGSAKNSKILNDIINVGEIVELPNGYIDGVYNTPLSTNYIFLDTRCKIVNRTDLININASFFSGGEINIVAIKPSTNEILLSEKRLVTVGINNISFTNETINEPFYVAIEPLTAELKTKTPADGEGFSFLKPSEGGAFTYMDYRISYSVNVKQKSLVDKLSSIQIMVRSDTTNIQQSLNSTKKLGLDAREFVVEDIIEVPDGSTITGIFGKSVLRKGGAFNDDFLMIEGKQDVVIENIRIEGDLPAYNYSMNGINSGVGIIGEPNEALSNSFKGLQNGINLKSSERIILNNIQFHNLNGVGLVCDRTGKDYIHGLKASQLFFYNCYKGIETKNEHEYSSYSDIMVSLCQIGADIDSGNLSFASPIITRCRYGMIIRGSGVNHAHGIITGAEIKHHQLAGLLIDNVQNGHMFHGLMMQYANLEIKNSKMISINDLFFSNGSINSINNNATIGKNVIGSLYNAGGLIKYNLDNLLIAKEFDLLSNV